MAVKAIPDGYQSVTPYLIVKGADRAIDFYRKVFGAVQRMRMDGPNGTVGHAEIEIDGSTIMLADEFPDMGYRSPQSIGGTGVSLHLYVQDVDVCFNRAVAAQGRRRFDPYRTNSTVTGPGRWKIPSAMCGRFRHIMKTSHPRNSRSGQKLL
jgi:PhnB protein